jgi:DNA helicase-2/ATP-dependent DNA helicase PcrA
MREVGVSATRHYGVLLLTAHKAKGLEFNTVFITGLVEGFFPLGKKTLKREHLEEERRLLYVALTRAQKNLFLTYPLYYKNEKKEPSRFILELVKRR